MGSTRTSQVGPHSSLHISEYLHSHSHFTKIDASECILSQTPRISLCEIAKCTMWTVFARARRFFIICSRPASSCERHKLYRYGPYLRRTLRRSELESGQQPHVPDSGCIWGERVRYAIDLLEPPRETILVANGTCIIEECQKRTKHWTHTTAMRDNDFSYCTQLCNFSSNSKRCLQIRWPWKSSWNSSSLQVPKA